MITKYFSAANTPNGFINYFDDAIDIDNAKQILYIKGGSGVGKSTLMHKVSDTANKLGYDVTHIHCSSDPTSLDGVVIDALQIALFDATMPHIADPRYPMINSEIVDLASFLDRDKLKVKKNDVISLIHNKKEHYATLYSLLATITPVISSMNKLIEVDKMALGNIKDEILANISLEGNSKRRGFLEAIDTTKIMSLTDSVIKGKKVHLIKSKYKSIALSLLTSISDQLSYLPQEKYYSILEPNKISTLSLKNDIITTDTSVTYDYVYDIDDLINIKNINAYKILYHYIDNIISLSSIELQQAKLSHNEIEKIYQSAMDFDRETVYTNALIDMLFDR